MMAQCIPSMINVSVDSVQLTQATRPKRRIYVENLPSSAFEATVIQWLSGYLRPFAVNHVLGTNPCIVNKDKRWVLVEYLIPEEASAALNFDGKLFSSNIIKITHPKDYVEETVRLVMGSKTKIYIILEFVTGWYSSTEFS